MVERKMSLTLVCPNCGSAALTKSGFKVIGGQKAQRYACGACGLVTVNPITAIEQLGGRQPSLDQVRDMQSTQASSQVHVPDTYWWINSTVLGRPNLIEILQPLVNEAAAALALIGVQLERGELPASQQISFLVLTPPSPSYVVEAQRTLEKMMLNYGLKISAYSFFNLAERSYFVPGPGGPQTAILMKVGPEAPAYGGARVRMNV
jgi:predicted RNA-binding Zn-ribbon protein involved in translation (DUF1610 family)